MGIDGARVKDARFVPRPPEQDLDSQIRDLLDWIVNDHQNTIDPVVAAGMAHYHFETLHPFNDGNGRIGRLLVVLHLMQAGVLVEPTLAVSPWFEARRADYYDRLLGVSTKGDWDAWIRFFATGLRTPALDTERSLADLLRVQADLKSKVRAAGLRAEKAIALVDYALEQPILTVRQVERHLAVTYARANGLVSQLVDAVCSGSTTTLSITASSQRPTFWPCSCDRHEGEDDPWWSSALRRNTNPVAGERSMSVQPIPAVGWRRERT